jgi:hypothetical protein
LFPAFCVCLLVLAGFWGLTAYSEDLGNGGARDLDNNIGSLPLVIVYSQEPLDLAGSSIRPSRILGEDMSWSYRYTGARLLTYSNNRWFLVPEPSSAYYHSAVTILQDSDKIKVEIVHPK